MSRRPNSAWLLAGAVLLGGLAACRLDDLAGTSEPLGDPLLDISLGPASDGAFPSATYRRGAAATGDTLLLTISNLPPAPTGTQYQVFLVDSTKADEAAALNLTPVGGFLTTTTRQRRPVNRDSSFTSVRVETSANVTSIVPTDTAQSYVLRVIDPAVTTNTHVIIAVTPTLVGARHLGRTERFGLLSARYRTGTTFTNTGSLVFGSFAIDQAQRIRFTTASAQIAGSFRGNTVRLNVRNLIRPPQGLQYAAWLLDARTGMALRLGGLLTPVPQNASLDSADVGTGTFLTDNAIIEGQVRGVKPDSAQFEDFTRLVLVLEPKGTTGARNVLPSAAYILTGPIPQSVASRSAAPGSLLATVTGGGRANATVYLAGAGSRTAALVNTTDATGAVRFRSVPVGRYTAYVIPSGGTTPTDSAPFRIVAKRQANGSLSGDTVSVTLRTP